MADGGSKKNNLKNYLILGVIFLVGIGLTLYLCKWYNVWDDYQKETPVIRGSLLEITYDDLEHYVMENPTTVIYMCTSNNDTCRSYEKDLKKVALKETLNDYVIYLNLSNLDQDEFINNFNNKYQFKTKLTTNYPAFVVFEDGKVSSILQGKKNKRLTISSTKQFLELNGIGE